MGEAGGVRLPLFPLGLVLFPGLVLPLHVFEERYRTLVRELLELAEPDRRFGVIAIREGREVGEGGVTALYEVGCVARLERASPTLDGRFDIVTVGAERFRLLGLGSGRPYLTGTVELLADPLGDPGEAAVLRRAVGAAYADYLSALAEVGGEQVEVGTLPGNATLVSYLVAATMRVDLADRQALLAQPSTRQRLSAELSLLRRESTLLRTLSAVPAPELTRSPVNTN